jgi:hypothetical protein
MTVLVCGVETQVTKRVNKAEGADTSGAEEGLKAMVVKVMTQKVIVCM